MDRALRGEISGEIREKWNAQVWVIVITFLVISIHTEVAKCDMSTFMWGSWWETQISAQAMRNNVKSFKEFLFLFAMKFGFVVSLFKNGCLESEKFKGSCLGFEISPFLLKESCICLLYLFARNGLLLLLYLLLLLCIYICVYLCMYLRICTCARTHIQYLYMEDSDYSSVFLKVLLYNRQTQ